MTASFYLFDVEHGQCAALQLPHGRWCIFDVGRSRGFSPVNHIAGNPSASMVALALMAPFKFLKATISHLHADHLDDYGSLFSYGPEFLRTVHFDAEYLADCKATCAHGSWQTVLGFAKAYTSGFRRATSAPDYAAITIREISLPVDFARALGGDANARVNNASIVTRIDVCGHRILLCGDMMNDAWKAIIANPGLYGQTWRPLVSNIDILVAPHHGHTSGYSVQLMNLARPAVVLASVQSRDPHVDSRYSCQPVRGLHVGDELHHCLTTRRMGHIKVVFHQPTGLQLAGSEYWSFGDYALPRIESTFLSY